MRGLTLYKTLNRDRTPCLGGRGAWPPVGEWYRVSGRLAPRRNGLHVCWLGQLVYWLGPVIWEVEVGDERIDEWDKIVVREARLVRPLEAWTDRVARHFAVDCAERALATWEAEYPLDFRPRLAIQAARRYADGAIPLGLMLDAGEAALHAARGARWSLARDAAEAAAAATHRSAGVAARNAARTAAVATGSERVREHERRWQTTRLMAALGLGWDELNGWLPDNWPETSAP